MRVQVRLSVLALVVGVLMAIAASTAAAAEAPEIEKFVATNCTVSTCGQEGTEPFTEPKQEISVEEAHKEGYTQAGGRVPYGITDFKVRTVGSYPHKVPTSIVTHIRTDVAPGLATNPFAVPQCSAANFGTTEAVPNTGFYEAPKCSSENVIGKNKVTVYAGESAGDVPLEGTVYDLEPENGLASEFGVALELPKPLTGGALAQGFKEAEEKGAVPGVGGFPSLGVQTFLEAQQYFAHTLIKGNVEWGKQAKGTGAGDYHDYFEIDVSPALPLIRSRLYFEGRSGNGAFITNATSCPGHNTTTLSMTDKEGTVVKKQFTTPIGLEGCESLLFEPSFALVPSTTQNDQPDEITAAASEPHNPKAVDQSQVKYAAITLPEGMTLNPSAAHGLEDCTPAQAHIHSEAFGVGCPAGSEVGTVSLDVPTLPNGSLTGKVYLGGPESGPITGTPFPIYVVANSERFGVSVRLEGEVHTDAVTGRVTTSFNEPPEQPFSNLTLKFTRGVLAPVGNPLICGTQSGSSTFVPYAQPHPNREAAFGVPITGCASSPLPFALAQGTANQNGNAGGHTSYTFNLERPDGNQYVSQVKTTLPAGVVGTIPAVTQCPEPLAAAGTCTVASQIGTATVLAGSGATPYQFSGPVSLTGPYQGAPFGLSIAVPAVAGPFNFGLVVTRARIDVDPTTGRVIVTSVLPRIVRGVPLRLRKITVAVDKQGFLFNPTDCSAQATESAITGFVPGTSESSTVNLSTPFQVANCAALKFKPSFKAASTAKVSKANGTSLETTINTVAGQANIKSVIVQLPKTLPSRLTTLQKACLAATFAVNPFHCPSGAFVGGVRAKTPVLPGTMKGPAILVSHGGAAFPDLDLVLEGDGVKVILVGNTNIKNGITTTKFVSTPDVPVSSITVNLPLGAHSALTTFGNVCAKPLVMPTTITGHNGVTIKQNTKINVKGCGVRIVGHKVAGHSVFLTVSTHEAGRISAGGSGLATVYRHVGHAVGAIGIKVSLSHRGLSRSKPFRTRVRVGFLPRSKGARASAAFVTVTIP
ncbi:MAG TPA: hypothetical protein VGN13_02900 [Solirubrobacteraceae bacterium]|jgi:hypothetical protein